MRKPDQHAIESRQRIVRDFEAEQVQQQAEIPWRVEAERRQSHFQLLRNVLAPPRLR